MKCNYRDTIEIPADYNTRIVHNCRHEGIWESENFNFSVLVDDGLYEC